MHEKVAANAAFQTRSFAVGHVARVEPNDSKVNLRRRGRHGRVRLQSKSQSDEVEYAYWFDVMTVLIETMLVRNGPPELVHLMIVMLVIWENEKGTGMMDFFYGALSIYLCRRVLAAGVGEWQSPLPKSKVPREEGRIKRGGGLSTTGVHGHTSSVFARIDIVHREVRDHMPRPPIFAVIVIVKIYWPMRPLNVLLGVKSTTCAGSNARRSFGDKTPLSSSGTKTCSVRAELATSTYKANLVKDRVSVSRMASQSVSKRKGAALCNIRMLAVVMNMPQRRWSSKHWTTLCSTPSHLPRLTSWGLVRENTHLLALNRQQFT